MIIKRKLFSKKKEENKNSNNTNSKAIGAGVTGIGMVGNKILGDKIKKHMESNNTEEGELLFDKVKKLAQRKGVKVDEFTKTGMGPAYSNNTIYTDGTKIDTAGYNIFGGSLPGEIKKTGTGRHGDLISHEFGHAHFDKGRAKGLGEKIGKAAHKAYLKTGGMFNHSLLAPTAGMIVGARSGKKAAEKEAAGEKESKLARHSGWATGLAVQSPGLISEGAASKYGYNVLKKAGASKKYLKGSKKNLVTAFGTYAGLAVANAGTSELARGIAYKKRKKKLEKEKNKKKDDK